MQGVLAAAPYAVHRRRRIQDNPGGRRPARSQMPPGIHFVMNGVNQFLLLHNPQQQHFLFADAVGQFLGQLLGHFLRWIVIQDVMHPLRYPRIIPELEIILDQVVHPPQSFAVGSGRCRVADAALAPIPAIGHHGFHPVYNLAQDGCRKGPRIDAGRPRQDRQPRHGQLKLEGALPGARVPQLQERTQVHQIPLRREIVGFGRLLGLLQQQQKLDDGGFAGAVAAQQHGNGTKPHRYRVIENPEVGKFQFGQHKASGGRARPPAAAPVLPAHYGADLIKPQLSPKHRPALPCRGCRITAILAPGPE